MVSAAFDVATALTQLERAATEQLLTAAAAANIRKWLTEPRYAQYAPQVAQHLAEERWRTLDDAFWTVIPFGTGGRRGRMYPIGTNAINDRTIGESARGLAEYVLRVRPTGERLSCAIAYDTRHNSRHFAELCAGIMVAAGFQVYFLDDYRSTPELSFLVRYQGCSCGIMVTASHNPPSDNAVKVYWSTGGQVLPPHDQAIIDCVMHVQEIPVADYAQAVADGRIHLCREEVDRVYVEQVRAQSTPGPRTLRILYSPLHGVGASAVCPALAAAGFEQVEVFGPHAQPNGDFPNVPGHVSNPENPGVFDAMIQYAQQQGHDLILATDPDCDRVGCAAPVTRDRAGAWRTFTGNQIGGLLADYLLQQRAAAGQLTRQHYVVKTLVTTELIRRIADSYQVKTYGDLLVGFKYIGGVMEEQGADKFVFGAEESHGYLVGQYARDKDGAVASMLLAELAAAVQARGKSLHEQLDSLYWQHGYHAEKLLNVTMEGSEGMARMEQLMARLRHDPPRELGGLPLAAVRDYGHSTRTPVGGRVEPLAGPVGDLIMLDLAAAGNFVAVRPSGTEPKVKCYMFTYVPAELLADLDQARREMADRLARLEQDLQQLAAAV